MKIVKNIRFLPIVLWDSGEMRAELRESIAESLRCIGNLKRKQMCGLKCQREWQCLKCSDKPICPLGFAVSKWCFPQWLVQNAVLCFLSIPGTHLENSPFLSTFQILLTTLWGFSLTVLLKIILVLQMRVCPLCKVNQIWANFYWASKSLFISLGKKDTFNTWLAIIV